MSRVTIEKIIRNFHSDNFIGVLSGVGWIGLTLVSALRVLRHLGLIYRPFVSHNLISTQEGSVPLLKFQMAPRLKILTSSSSKKGTQIYFIFSLKNPGKRTPSRFTNRVPMERDTRLQGICISLENLIKIPLNKKAVRKKHTYMFPRSVANMEAEAHFLAMLNISFGVPSKGGLPQGIPRRKRPRS